MDATRPHGRGNILLQQTGPSNCAAIAGARSPCPAFEVVMQSGLLELPMLMQLLRQWSQRKDWSSEYEGSHGLVQ